LIAGRAVDDALVLEPHAAEVVGHRLRLGVAVVLRLARQDAAADVAGRLRPHRVGRGEVRVRLCRGRGEIVFEAEITRVDHRPLHLLVSGQLDLLGAG